LRNLEAERTFCWRSERVGTNQFVIIRSTFPRAADHGNKKNLQDTSVVGAIMISYVNNHGG